ncbi:MAG: hypothetical protein OEL76_06780 [Siculibacillus sp.]|nr:hypothetical protein [Siculibacillus sp.]
MEPPFLAESGTTVVVGPQAIFEAVDVIRGAGREKEFLDAYAAAGLQLRVPAELVNFLKNFIFGRQLHKTNLMAAAVVKSMTCPKADD